MLPLIACLLVSQSAVDQPKRLRTVLENGSVVCVERVPNASSVSVQLFISARNNPETVQTNGFRHLLEHIIAKGTHKDLDLKIESAGGFLNAHTGRDSMRIDVTLPRDKFRLGLEAIAETMQMPDTSSEDLHREAQIITHEAALRELPERMSAAAWDVAYGTDGLDAFGNLDVIRHAEVADMIALDRKMFVGANLVVSIAGDVDVELATSAARRIVEAVPAGVQVPFLPRRTASAGEVQISGSGSARAAAIPGFRSPKATWIIAAGLAVAAKAPHSFFIYSPTSRDGLVIVGQTEGNEIQQIFDSPDPNRLLRSAKSLVRGWINSQLQDPSSIAGFRGLLFAQSLTLRPETVLENVETMTARDFAVGLAAFSRERCVVVKTE